MEVARQALSVLLVFALLGMAMWAIRRGQNPFRAAFSRSHGPRTKSLQSLERLTLTPQHSLHLVRVGGTEVVVATHPQGCALLIERQAREGFADVRSATGGELGYGANS